MSLVYIDLTELIANPINTGIQRTERELIRHWPGPTRLVPIFYCPSKNTFCKLAQDIFSILVSIEPKTSDLQRQTLAQFIDQSLPIAITDQVRILNLELFFDAGRSNKYIEITSSSAAKVFWLTYDFLVYLRPDFFPQRTTAHCMHYLRALHHIPYVAFISQQTAKEFASKISRGTGQTGPVFNLGGDGLRLERQVFETKRNIFAVIGTIEPRKRVATILEAFAKLWERGSTVELAIAGRLLATAEKEKQLLDMLDGDPRLHVIGEFTDDQLITLLRQTRAILFVSEAEGFGIPAYEALHMGIPLICSAHGIPSISRIPHFGQIRLDEVSIQSLTKAVEEMSNDTIAARLWNEAAHTKIPLWRDFANDVARWVQDS